MRVLSGAGLFTAPGAGSGVHWVVEHLRVSDLSVGTDVWRYRRPRGWPGTAWDGPRADGHGDVPGGG
jgi:hypothetical protein